ncbi:MAG: hypothetical protein MJ211_13130 [Bacteroidales bacterium]|nr:hypothetical protein [Bacteroidales bacterium]
MKKLLLFIIICCCNIVYAQSGSDVLAIIRNDSLFLYDTDNKITTYLTLLPSVGKWHFTNVEYASGISDVCLCNNDTTLIYRIENNSIVSLSLVNGKRNPLRMVRYYTIEDDIIVEENGREPSVFFKSRINKSATPKNVEKIGERLYHDTIAILGCPLPRNSREEYNVCDLSPSGDKLIVLYCVTKNCGKKQCIIPVVCEIDINRRSIDRINIKGYNAKYSPSSKYYLYYQTKRFGKDLLNVFCVYDSENKENIFLEGVKDAVWINRNLDVVLSSKMYYIYMANLWK